MTKHDLLAYLADVGEADAVDMASALGVPYATSAMAALRLVRQHLASRAVDPDRTLYTYQLTDHGHARLAFFEDDGPAHPRESDASASRRHPVPAKGAHLMKRKKLHTGTYHCPACFIELDLVGEGSLKCEECGGPLATGGLDEVWADDEEDEE